VTDQQPESQAVVTGGTQGISPPRSSGPLLSKRQKSYSLLVALLFLVLGVLGYRWATDRSLATLVDYSGQPERDVKKSVAQWSKASPGDKFYEGDGARTPPNAEAHFKIAGGSRLRLKPASQIRFLRNHKGKKGTIGLQVEVGEADVRTDEGMLSLDSEFGPILIEANSAVTLRRQGQNMVLNVDLGTIEIGNERRSLQAGQSVELEVGGIEVVEQATAVPPEPARKDTPEEPSVSLDFGDGVNRYDLVVGAGATFVVHDPKPPTRIGFRVGNLCTGPARLTSGSLKTEAQGTVGLTFDQGRHGYEVRCMDSPDKVAAKGDLTILRDAGTRTLPAFAPSATVATDGRKYTVLYQQRLPKVTVTWPSAPEASGYTLTAGGRTISTSAPHHTFQSGALPAGTHQVVFSANTDPPRKSRTTTVHVVYDTQAPAARVSDPPSGYASGSSVTVAGQALPGWKVSVEGKELEMDSQLRFSSQISAGSSLPIAFSHPTHGMHYYLRRSASP
jgi:hypothetical protein